MKALHPSLQARASGAPRLRVLAACGALAAAGALPGAAKAEDKPLWELGGGVGGLVLPHYRGSANSQQWLLPVPYYVYRGRIFKADRDGARALLLDTRRVDLDLSLAASAPANSEGDSAREGMPNLAGTVELGPRLNLHLADGRDWKLDLRLPLRAAVTLQSRPRDIGWTFTPVLNLDWRLPVFDLGVQAGPIWSDRRQNGYFYGVAPEYSTATRPAYQARGGYGGWQGTLAASRRVGHFWAGAFVRRDSVAGAVFEPSPLVTQRTGWSYGFAVSYVFAVSETRVPVED